MLAANIYVIDPAGIYELTGNMPDMDFIVCYLDADDEKRRQMAIRRADDKAEAARAFDARDAEESPVFDEFKRFLLEDRTGMTSHMPANIRASVIFRNDYEEDTIPAIADDLQHMLRF